jgi:lysylphosphatidylglycerol synthetase-like protein (DUF2156 family)
MQEKDQKLFNIEVMELFRDKWAKYDPDATAYISLENFREFMFALGSPIGWDKTFADPKK